MGHWTQEGGIVLGATTPAGHGNRSLSGRGGPQSTLQGPPATSTSTPTSTPGAYTYVDNEAPDANCADVDENFVGGKVATTPGMARAHEATAYEAERQRKIAERHASMRGNATGGGSPQRPPQQQQIEAPPQQQRQVHQNATYNGGKIG